MGQSMIFRVESPRQACSPPPTSSPPSSPSPLPSPPCPPPATATRHVMGGAPATTTKLFSIARAQSQAPPLAPHLATRPCSSSAPPIVPTPTTWASQPAHCWARAAPVTQSRTHPTQKRSTLGFHYPTAGGCTSRPSRPARLTTRYPLPLYRPPALAWMILQPLQPTSLRRRRRTTTWN